MIIFQLISMPIGLMFDFSLHYDYFPINSYTYKFNVWPLIA